MRRATTLSSGGRRCALLRHQVGLDHKTEAQKKAELKAKKDAKTREEEELRMLFSQLQHGATKRSKAEEAAAQVRVRACVCVASADARHDDNTVLLVELGTVGGLLSLCVGRCGGRALGLMMVGWGVCGVVQAEQERLAADKDAQQGWVDQDMTGKPLEEVIEYQVRGRASHA